jgi:hypothetical protein
MPWTIDSALEDDLVTVVERDDDEGEFILRIGDLNTIVTISLRRFMNDDRTRFIVSHAIHTPSQAGPYKTSVQVADDPAYALHRAVSGLTDYFREAIKAGHKPAETWLVPWER